MRPRRYVDSDHVSNPCNSIQPPETIRKGARWAPNSRPLPDVQLLISGVSSFKELSNSHMMVPVFRRKTHLPGYVNLIDFCLNTINKTTLKLGMEDGDQIDAFLEQVSRKIVLHCPTLSPTSQLGGHYNTTRWGALTSSAVP